VGEIGSSDFAHALIEGEVARRYGFSEIGRFAIRYRAFFGETPSATLRRPQSSMENAPLVENA
jgi:hypothetical protein